MAGKLPDEMAVVVVVIGGHAAWVTDACSNIVAALVVTLLRSLHSNVGCSGSLGLCCNWAQQSLWLQVILVASVIAASLAVLLPLLELLPLFDSPSLFTYLQPILSQQQSSL